MQCLLEHPLLPEPSSPDSLQLLRAAVTREEEDCLLYAHLYK